MKIITGMHRSGTSFVCQVVQRLGGDFGAHEDLFPADKWNQHGYLESLDVIDINNRLILGHGAKLKYWLEPQESRLKRALYTAISGKWKYVLCPGPELLRGRTARWNERIRHVHEKYRGKYVKDPRLCVTIRQWAEQGPVDHVILSYRNPAQVAGSLNRREGTPLWLGYRMWKYHMNMFFSQLPADMPLLLIDFDNFFSAGRAEQELSRLATALGKSAEEINAEDIVDESARTQVSHEVRDSRCAQIYADLKALHASSESFFEYQPGSLLARSISQCEF